MFESLEAVWTYQGK